MRGFKSRQIFIRPPGRGSYRGQSERRAPQVQLPLLITFLITYVVLTRNASATAPREYLLDQLARDPVVGLIARAIFQRGEEMPMHPFARRRCRLSHRVSQR